MRSNIILKVYDTELQGQHTNDGMNHLKNIQVIEQTISDNRLCLFYIKAPDCGKSLPQCQRRLALSAGKEPVQE